MQCRYMANEERLLTTSFRVNPKRKERLEKIAKMASEALGVRVTVTDLINQRIDDKSLDEMERRYLPNNLQQVN